jgi:hypothetical protein
MLATSGGVMEPAPSSVPHPDQEITMFKAIGMFFNSFYAVFFAVDQGAQAVSQLAILANEEATGFTEQMRIERKARIAKVMASVKAA